MGVTMRVKSAHFKDFKRFTNFRIEDLPSTATLVVLAGPNGCGKSSVFDGFRTWSGKFGVAGYAWDETYGLKAGSTPRTLTELVDMEFHDQPASMAEPARTIYQRTAFRNEAEFSVTNLAAIESPLAQARPRRLIDNDVSVSENYRRMIWQTLEGVYSDALPEDMRRADLRDRVIGQVREALTKVYPDLHLLGVGAIGPDLNRGGTFYFRKGAVEQLLYKNLSAGEKAAFDLILDLVIKREFFNDTIWCIDEPDTHLNTRVQGVLLEALLDLLPPRCQLWIASHSLGFMRKATERAHARGDVVFLDMSGIDFDQPQVLRPTQPTRHFWAKTLDVALGDVATLVAPERVVLCEGRPPRNDRDLNAAFDAECYRTIFQDAHPDTDFISVGNSQDADSDRLGIEGVIQALKIDTVVVRLRDRDLLSEQEVVAVERLGTRVLSRRHLESYLFDDEVIEALCVKWGQPDKVSEVLAAKKQAVVDRTAQGKDLDDIKSAAGLIYLELRRRLSITSPGSDHRAFARDVLAPLVAPGMTVFRELERDIFSPRGNERPSTS